MIFPSFVALKASTRFKYTEIFITRGYGGYIEFNPEAQVPSLPARFVVERVGDTDLVHIRSCYQNNYLCRTRESGGYIVAASDEPIDDEYAVNCTLFKVTELGSQVVTFTHVGTGKCLGGWRYSQLSQKLAILNNNVKECVTKFKVVGYDSLVRLPKRVIFKGDNDRFLRCRWQRPDIDLQQLGGSLIIMAAVGTTFDPNTNRSERYNDFGSKDGSERSAHYEITHYNGTIRIKSLAFEKYLRRCTISSYDSWIWGDDDSEINNSNICNNLDSLFKVENLGDNVIALRNLGNNKVCTRLSVNGLSNGLKAAENYAGSGARMVVEEPVARRKVEAQYKLSGAKITSQKLTYHSTATGVNKYDNRDDDLNFSFTYDKTRTTTWNTTTIVTKNASAEINIPIPKYIDGKIQLSGQTVENKHFEKGSTSSIKTTIVYKIKVPPKTRAIIKGYVQEVTYDIPYSYIQTDTYTTGEQDTIVDENGVCQCVEAYDYHCEKEYIPL